MPVELPKSLVNVLESLANTLHEGEYKSVKDVIEYPDGSTLAENFPDVFSRLSLVAEALGINYSDCEYTFTVTKSANNGKPYINYPNIRLIDGVPTLCWGDVKRPLHELTYKAISLKTVPSMSNKPGAKPKYFLNIKLPNAYWKQLGLTEVAFPMSTKPEVDEIDLACAIDSEHSEDPLAYQEAWQLVLRAQSQGSFKPFPRSLGKLFAKHPEVDPTRLIESVEELLSQPSCEPLSIRVTVTDAEIEDGKFGASLVMNLCEGGYDIENPYAATYGRYKVSLKTQLGQKFDPHNPEAFIGTDFTVVAEGVGEAPNGTPYVKTRIEGLTLPMHKTGNMPSWDSISDY